MVIWGKIGLKISPPAADALSMLILLTLVTVGYFVAVVRVRRRRTAGAVSAEAGTLAALPQDDLPPVSAVGWPPEGGRFTTYVDQGFAAIDAYLSEDRAA